jgi:hypothetical protein
MTSICRSSYITLATATSTINILLTIISDATIINAIAILTLTNAAARVMLEIGAPLKIIIYDRNVYIVKATGANVSSSPKAGQKS